MPWIRTHYYCDNCFHSHYEFDVSDARRRLLQMSSNWEYKHAMLVKHKYLLGYLAANVR